MRQSSCQPKRLRQVTTPIGCKSNFNDLRLATRDANGGRVYIENQQRVQWVPSFYLCSGAVETASAADPLAMESGETHLGRIHSN